MDCPNCGQKRGLQDRICSSCRYFFEGGAVIDVEPPRAGRGPAGEPHQQSRHAAALRDAFRRALPRPWMRLALAGLVPGLGHSIGGDRRRGLTYLLAVLGILAVACPLFGFTLGQLLFGIAGAVHAFSIFELTPWKADPDPRRRIAAILVIQMGLGLIYYPLFQALANAMVGVARINRGLFGLGVWIAIGLAVVVASWVWAFYRARRGLPPHGEP